MENQLHKSRRVSSFLGTRAFFLTPLILSVLENLLGKVHTLKALQTMSYTRSARLVDGLRRWRIGFWLPVPSQVQYNCFTYYRICTFIIFKREIPFAGRPAWSMFGICDGHGGSFCSSYLSEQLPILVAREVSKRADGSGLNLGTANDSDATPESLKGLLHRVCIDADKKLQEHPRMAVEWTQRGNISCFDSSGSTAVMAVVTSRYVAVANVGDSRCVLAQKASDVPDSLNTPFRDNMPTRRNSSSSHLLATGLSNDHKLNDPIEKARAEAAGAM